MPDISMCSNKTCPLRTICYRHEDSGTKPSEYVQAFGNFQWFDLGPHGIPQTYCSEFIEVVNRRKEPYHDKA